MDEFNEMELPVENGFHLDKDIVGEHLKNYESILVLSHFKGHAMECFDGALKNISIRIGSTRGKTYIHKAGLTTKADELFDKLPSQDHFLESMADACKAVINYKRAENMVYINVANRVSVDCDCDSHPAEPEMGAWEFLPLSIRWLWIRHVMTRSFIRPIPEMKPRQTRRKQGNKSHLRKLAVPVRFSAVDFPVMPEISLAIFPA